MTISLTTRTGVGRALTWAEADANWSAIQSAINALQATSPGRGIDTFTQPTPGALLVTFSDTTTASFTLPVGLFNYRGVWVTATSYAVNDTFQVGGSLYVVLVAHTSAATFDSGANDGAGHDYYQEMLSVPAAPVLPLGTLGASGTTSASDASSVWKTTPTGALLINASSVGQNHLLIVVVTTSGTTSYDITFGSNFKSAGVLATGAVTAKTFTVSFMGDGTTYYEIARTAAM